MSFIKLDVVSTIVVPQCRSVVAVYRRQCEGLADTYIVGIVDDSVQFASHSEAVNRALSIGADIAEAYGEVCHDEETAH